ncbi:alpha/beta fold hydrolase [Bacillus sp. 165]|uniref:alpha/beta hydrolase family protein n=1 Tax=Bacillus sp. 165 TaxID=1529117 RepID=UPI001ADD21B0|nr:alpha/beta fold hydrolase [Bacillus sp. 165]MBO9128164.1 alpha/beta fold hydrolase [Bacillus sp. 165]
MQEAVSIIHQNQTLRGMEHIPDGKEHVPAVILFHGFTGTKLEPHRLFLKISRELEKRGIASFRFDFLGSGESDGNFEDMTVGKEVAEAKTIFEYVQGHPQVDKGRIMVLGFSMGGLVASMLAGELKESIHKLILLAPAGTIGKKSDLFANESNYIPELDAYDAGGNVIGRAFIEEIRTLDAFARAKSYEGKVLLIHGTADQSVPFETSSLYIQKCYGKNATLHVIEGADHTFNKYDWEQNVINAACGFASRG